MLIKTAIGWANWQPKNLIPIGPQVFDLGKNMGIPGSSDFDNVEDFLNDYASRLLRSLGQ